MRPLNKDHQIYSEFNSGFVGSMFWRMLIFLLSISILMCVLSSCFRKQSSSAIGQLSKEERLDLEGFCMYLLQDTEVGYTLFGTKPVSYLIFDNRIPSRLLNKQQLLVARVLPTIRRIAPIVKMKKYIFSCNSNSLYTEIYLVNWESFSKIVKKEREIFERRGLKLSDPSKLLSLFLNNGDFFHSVCNKDEVLFGICLGYGAHNALVWERRRQLLHFFASKKFPRLKDENCASFCRKENMRLSSRERAVSRQYSSSIGTLASPVLSSEFASLHDELLYLNRALQLNTSFEFGEIAQVRLPAFMAVLDSPETVMLMMQYKRQQKHLQEIVSSKCILEIIVAKLTEE